MLNLRDQSLPHLSPLDSVFYGFVSDVTFHMSKCSFCSGSFVGIDSSEKGLPYGIWDLILWVTHFLL